ncbi:MAG: NADPH-dependent glutamate synthase [Chloroflexi bacterium]|nr:NADPH-dependent glutamate synthase [Chloroflexota bacterium]
MAKLNLNRVDMPIQDPKARGRNFSEVTLGYNPELSLEEALRCIQCPKPLCTQGCPVGIDIRDFIKPLREGNMEEAVRVLKSKNNLPAICGRVCPQESQCEAKCVVGKRGAPVAIGRLERFVADWEINSAYKAHVELPKPTGKRVAVIGSGPAGLTCGADLAWRGHQVTIYEALHVAGGVLVYGIPEFRLPKRIVQAEIDNIAALGVEIVLDTVVGRSVTIDELLADGYHAVFLGTGAGLPMFLNVPGENLNGIYSANEFLTRANLMKAYDFPRYDTPLKMGKRVAVVGGGNVAMDAARVALRLGAEQVYIVYRRSEVELPARHEEVEHAKEEGIIFHVLTNPVGFVGGGRGLVTGMECIRMKLGEPDASGRRRPIPMPGSEFLLPVDTVVVALGTTPNPIIAATTPGLQTTPHGTLVADEETGKTTKDRVWAGGDIVTGAATVISAMGAGKRAAASMDAFLKGGA